MDIEAIKQIALAATPGPWVAEERTDSFNPQYPDYGIHKVASIRWYSDSDSAHTALDTMSKEDAGFIAAFNPETALALIAEVERLHSLNIKAEEVLRGYIPEVKRLQAKLEKVKPQISRIYRLHRRVSIPPYVGDLEHCFSCRDEFGNHVLHPCPTIRAVEEQ